MKKFVVFNMIISIAILGTIESFASPGVSHLPGPAVRVKYEVSVGETKQIVSDSGVCQSITNSCTMSVFVPFKTAGEVANNPSKAPACVTFSACAAATTWSQSCTGHGCGPGGKPLCPAGDPTGIACAVAGGWCQGTVHDFSCM